MSDIDRLDRQMAKVGEDLENNIAKSLANRTPVLRKRKL